MAGPIRISVLADASAATRSVNEFAGSVDGGVTRAARGLEDANRRVQRSQQDVADGFERSADAADRAETRAQGFRDTITGTQDAMAGAAAVAKGDYVSGMLLLGSGAADLASGFANFLIPAIGAASKSMFTSAVSTVRATAASVGHRVALVAGAAATGAMTAAQWLLNAAMTANPIGLVILAIVALVAAVIIAWKRSETFRRIVTSAFNAVRGAAVAVWNWIKGNWPLLLAIITGPIGIAIRFVIRHFDSIKAKVRSIPGAIRGVFANAGSLLTGAGRRIVEGLWRGITGLAGWLAGKVRSFITSTVPGPIARALGIASPSKVTRALGRFTGRGLGLGLEDERSRVQRAAASLAGAAVPVPSGSAAGGAGGGRGGLITLVFESNGDPLMDAIWAEFQRRVRVRGGNVQVAVTGRP